MKVILITFLLSPFILFAQIDTIPKGNVTLIDSAQQLKIVYPFKNSLVNGTVKAYYLVNNNLAYEGTSKDNQKQGTWNYYEYDSLNNKSIYQYFNYTNDTLNGPFTEVQDSLRIAGSYKNALLEGVYKREVSSPSNTGTVVWTPIDSGQYTGGKMYGQWTFLYNGKLHKTGYYIDGKKHKHWFVYDIYDKSSEDVLMLETQYFEGVKTGNEKKYFHYRFDSCGTGCVDTVKVNEYEQIPWQNGRLLGTYIKKNGKGTVIEKGTYSDGKKVSQWTYFTPSTKEKETKTYLEDKLNGPYKKQVGEHVILEGTYAVGKKNKTWKYSDENGKALREEQYDNGKKTGEWKYFNYRGYVGVSKLFEDDQLTRITEYNDVEVDVLNLDFTFNENDIEIVSEELFDDSVEVKTLLYTPGEKGFDHNTFMKLFKEKGKDTSVFVLNGGCMVKKGGSVEFSGVYKMNIKNGIWDYFYNASIIWKIEFKDGIQTKETFVEKINGNPVLKGEYLLWYGPERPKLEFKIKDGVRHGKSTWYLRNGEVSKEEKYKEGILQ
ncbi:MAG: hypothetical protein CL840_10705 [Crocinitomicaceae bacterium]|nr:hypothetical protein [Crocinitomicaceae bacterium]|tara:strand:+ start:43086 stop:44723 length:1638 start_codon:yes stop_codon:yes gene_type:complete